MTDLRFTRSTHAPLYKRYMNGFEEVGVPGMYGPIDPETGAEYKALGGKDHRYNRDYKVGSSYPETVFIFGNTETGGSVDHDELRYTLKNVGLWTSRLKPVIVPQGMEAGEYTWSYGYQVSPPERAPYLGTVAARLEREGFELWESDYTIEAWKVE